MASIGSRIGLLTDIFLGAAFADESLQEKERTYVRALILDLLAKPDLPQEIAERIDNFDPARFNLAEAAADFAREPPMSKRRLLELVAFVTEADGEQRPEESAYVRALGELLGLSPTFYADLTRDRLRLRQSFTDLARVPLPR